MTQTIIPISASADDELVFRGAVGSSTYPPTSAVQRSSSDTNLYAARNFDTAASWYRILNGLMVFDTSSIPDGDTVTSAILRLWGLGRNNVNARMVAFDWYLRVGTDADYSEDALTTAHAGILTSAVVVDADNDFTLLNPAANINKSGNTGLRMHITGGEPTGTNQASFASFDRPTVPDPRLVIEHDTPPSVPTGLTATVL